MTGTRWPRRAAIVAPLLLVNSAAIYGQYGWAHEHLGHNPVTAALFAAAVESIGIYLAYEAHAALMAGDASARLRLASYGVGVLVGCLNYGHYSAAHGYRPNPLAVTFGLLSSISPWLWSIRSRSLNRDRLRELGQIDPRAVRFSILRWTLFPIRTVRAFRHAVWAGIVQPAEAVAAAEERYGWRRPGARPVPVLAAPVIEQVSPPVPELEPVPETAPEPVATRAAKAKTDAQLLAALRNLRRVPRDPDGTVPIRRAARTLEIGPDRAKRLLTEAGLLSTGDDAEGEPEPVPAKVNGVVPTTEGVPA